MRPIRLLLVVVTALALAGCSFEDPPSPTGGQSTPAQIPGPVVEDDPCTAYAVTLLDGLLNGLPSADEQTAEKAGRVADQFQVRYDQVIAAKGVEAARAEYADDIRAACTG